MPYAKTDDRIRIYYEEHGRDGTPVVLAYGLGGTTDMWDVNLPALAARHRVVLWEPRGQGRSDCPADPAKYSFTRWALDLRDLLDHLGLRRAHIGGHSLGAGVATRFTLLEPRRALSLVITNSASAAGLPMSVENLVMRAKSVQIALTRGMDAMAEFAMAENANFRARLALNPNAAQEVYEEYRRLDATGYANSVRALLAMDHITDQLPGIRVPTLVIAGDRDPSLDAMKLIHRKVRGSKMVVLSPAGHFANRDQADGWDRAVLRFLAGVARPRLRGGSAQKRPSAVRRRPAR